MKSVCEKIESVVSQHDGADLRLVQFLPFSHRFFNALSQFHPRCHSSPADSRTVFTI